MHKQTNYRFFCRVIIITASVLVHAYDHCEQNAQQYLEQGRIYYNEQNIDAAIQAYQAAHESDPDDLNITFEYARICQREQLFDKAAALYQKIVQQSNIPSAHFQLAQTLRSLGKMADAIPHYEKMLEFQPDNAHAHYGLGETSLAFGNFIVGWNEFEWRWKRSADTRNFSEKLWDGSNPAGKTILIRAEYGLGDTIQFIRYAKTLKQMGAATIIIESQRALIPLFSICPYIDKVIPVSDPVGPLPEFDIQIPVMSFPRIFKTTVDTVPTDVIPYIQPSPYLATIWKAALAHGNKFKIGICWEGSPYYESFRPRLSHKGIPLTLFYQLAQIENVTLYSLQQQNGTEQLDNLPKGIRVRSFGENFDNLDGRFMDTAAVIMNLDLIITIDTSVAHLAGAMGKPVWVLLPYVADWRWLLNRDDSPWYPTMRLFRQKEPGDWSEVMERVKTELGELVERRSHAA